MKLEQITENERNTMKLKITSVCAMLLLATFVAVNADSGTPNEMVTMYYEQGGKLALTHYCMFGNRPGMLLKSADSNSISFDFDKTCGINTATESHMHALTIHFDDPNTITTSCKAMMEGKEMEEHPTTLKRVKS